MPALKFLLGKTPFSGRELFILLIVSSMSFLANLPGSIGSNLIDRKLLLATLTAVTVIAMFRYLQVLLLTIISILALGANLPKDMAQALGVSQTALITSLLVLVVVTVINRLFKLMPSDREYADVTTSQDTVDSHQNLITAISKGNVAAIRKLLDMDAEINFTLKGTTPLHLAAEKGYSTIVKLLIDHGANVFMLNADGMTPLDVALVKKKFDLTTDILFHATKPHATKSVVPG